MVGSTAGGHGDDIFGTSDRGGGQIIPARCSLARKQALAGRDGGFSLGTELAKISAESITLQRGAEPWKSWSASKHRSPASQLPFVRRHGCRRAVFRYPVILTLHWHGFLRERLVDLEEAEVVAYIPIPSSALQVNDRWTDLLDLDRAAMEAGWELGAWDVAPAGGLVSLAPGADSSEAIDCLKAFGAFPFGINGQQPVVADAPDVDGLLSVACRRGYLMWLFRPGARRDLGRGRERRHAASGRRARAPLSASRRSAPPSASRTARSTASGALVPAGAPTRCCSVLRTRRAGRGRAPHPEADAGLYFREAEVFLGRQLRTRL